MLSSGFIFRTEAKPAKILTFLLSRDPLKMPNIFRKQPKIPKIDQSTIESTKITPCSVCALPLGFDSVLEPRSMQSKFQLEEDEVLLEMYEVKTWRKIVINREMVTVSVFRYRRFQRFGSQNLPGLPIERRVVLINPRSPLSRSLDCDWTRDIDRLVLQNNLDRRSLVNKVVQILLNAPVATIHWAETDYPGELYYKNASIFVYPTRRDDGLPNGKIVVWQHAEDRNILFPIRYFTGTKRGRAAYGDFLDSVSPRQREPGKTAFIMTGTSYNSNGNF